ncbi:hypothetical protein SBY92_004476 [Candida maltosa Xu316]
MADISPSNNKVDDFLSSLSQLSRERLREDQQRQRNLQRNINELQSRSNSTSPVKSFSASTSTSLDKSSYKYSIPESETISERYEVGDEDEENAPKLPKRPTDENDKPPPPLPTRKYKEKQQQEEEEEDEDDAPPLPRRKFEKEPQHEPLRSIPKKSAFPMPKPSSNNSASTTANSTRSFRDIESMIKTGQPKKSAPPLPVKQKPPTTPVKPAPKADWLTSLSTAKSTTSTPQASSPDGKKGPPSPTSHKSWIDSAVSKNEGKIALEKPRKPLFLKNTTKPEIPKKLIKVEQDLGSKEQEEFKLKFQSIKSSSPERFQGKKFAKETTPEIKEFESKIGQLRSQASERKPFEKTSDEKEFESKINQLRSQSPTRKVSDDKEFESKISQLRSQSPTRKTFEKTQDEKEFMSKFEKFKTGPVPPLKPKNISSYNEPPPEFQKRFEKIVSKAPPKPAKPSKGSLSSYQEKDAEELRSQLKRLGSVKKTEDSKPPKPPVIKETKPQPAPVEEETSPPEELSFEKKLGAILSKSNTYPKAGKPDSIKPGLQRTNTTPMKKKEDTKNSDKLTHLSKGRSKGPKRRLPKNMSKSTTAAIKEEKEVPETIPDFKLKKKVPPPINKHTKPKEIGELKPSRVISGELFI